MLNTFQGVLLMLTTVMLWAGERFFYRILPSHYGSGFVLTVVHAVVLLTLWGIFYKTIRRSLNLKTLILVFPSALGAALVRFFFLLSARTLDISTLSYGITLRTALLPVYLLIFRRQLSNPCVWMGAILIAIGSVQAMHFREENLYGLILLAGYLVSVCFASVTLNDVVRKTDPVMVVFIHELIVFVFGLISWGGAEHFSCDRVLDPLFVSAVVYAAIFATLFASLCSAYAQTTLAVMPSVLIQNLEIVIVTIYSVVLPPVFGVHEEITPTLVFACVCAAGGGIIGQLPYESLKRRFSGFWR